MARMTRAQVGAMVGLGVAGVALGSVGGYAAAQTGAAGVPQAEYDAVVASVEAYADEVGRLHAQVEAAEAEAGMLASWLNEAEADLDMAHEVMTQSARFYEDGSGHVTVWRVGADGFMDSYEVAVCEQGALCDGDAR